VIEKVVKLCVLTVRLAKISDVFFKIFLRIHAALMVFVPTNLIAAVDTLLG
jgi:hypothetical protein